MLKENEFLIEDGLSRKGNFRTKLIFQVFTSDGEFFDHDVTVSCSEDIDRVFKLYHLKNWNELFCEWDSTPRSWVRNITDVTFEEIYIVAKEENKGHVYMRIDSSQKVMVTVDLESMGDKNATKIKEIRNILNK